VLSHASEPITPKNKTRNKAFCSRSRQRDWGVISTGYYVVIPAISWPGSKDNDVFEWLDRGLRRE
jgi:hypothetical protein